MKKFIAILAIAGTLTACNNDSSSTETSDTTTMVEPTVPDTTKVVTTTTTDVDTMHKEGKDTTDNK
jgi:ABC-type glycerol-3-phosphate transport system substrate-binding protein